MNNTVKWIALPLWLPLNFQVYVFDNSEMLRVTGQIYLFGLLVKTITIGRGSLPGTLQILK